MKKEAFTPLEKFNLIRKYSYLTGFTLLEILIIIVIIGILGTLAVIQYQPYKESTLDREAQSNLKLIYQAERNFKLMSDLGVYAGPYPTTSTSNPNSEINSHLKLKLPTTTSNWTYTINTCDSSGHNRFTAKAQRVTTDPVIQRNWCLHSNDPSDLSASSTDPVPTRPNPGTTACSCP